MSAATQNGYRIAVIQHFPEFMGDDNHRELFFEGELPQAAQNLFGFTGGEG